jgi:hypothetical protein
MKTQYHDFIFNYHYDNHKSNLGVNISIGNVAISNVRVMFNELGVVSTKRPHTKWTCYEHLLVIEDTNQNQVHHFKKGNVL